ncbi:NAD(P)-binding protein [Bimuria novae-zelandiae CBS 107.79]|uniref:NAD(P)-binding protein n=1 Tax=Bimuria novae-zelandiae CBS 107.79 TaxID=1447943 RepID=A0A6A5UMZ7_9PLEO|nr:NAD(P)-binding protein [Bimuria novae-zelandiae CBS 107.79]
MTSYVIVGASRGLDYQYLKTLSASPSNIVIGLARSPAPVQSKVSADNLPSNVHILHGDLTDPSSLNVAAAQVSKITSGAVDYLIINGALLPYETAHLGPLDFAGNEQAFMEELNASMSTNVAGVMWTVNAFINLVKNSNVKTVIFISSCMADTELIGITGIAAAVPYAVSKAGANVVVAKYAALYKSTGVVFLALGPGFVQTQAEDPDNVPPELAAVQDAFTVAFRKYEPGLRGPILPEESVRMQLEVIKGITIKDSGKFLSHLGTKKML